MYVLKGSALQPLGSKHGCDPYIKLRLGKSVVDDRKAHLSDTRNPMFHRGGSVPTGSLLGFALCIPSTPLRSCAVLVFEYKVVVLIEVQALGLHRSITARCQLQLDCSSRAYSFASGILSLQVSSCVLPSLV